MPVLEELQRQSETRFLSIYEALAQNGFGPLDGEVAKAMRFRPQAIRKLPFDKRAKKARSLIEGKRNAELAYELFGTYLVTTKKDLVTAFLDATGVPHEDGMIQNPDASAPDEGKLEEAVRALDAAHDPADVTLYLAIAAEQWPGSALLQRIWKERTAS